VGLAGGSDFGPSFFPVHALFNSRETFLIEYSSYKESGIQAELERGRSRNLWRNRGVEKKHTSRTTLLAVRGGTE
jgi:hypothetical protein